MSPGTEVTAGALQAALPRDLRDLVFQPETARMLPRTEGQGQGRVLLKALEEEHVPGDSCAPRASAGARVRPRHRLRVCDPEAEDCTAERHRCQRQRAHKRADVKAPAVLGGGGLTRTGATCVRQEGGRGGGHCLEDLGLSTVP